MHCLPVDKVGDRPFEVAQVHILAAQDAEMVDPMGNANMSESDCSDPASSFKLNPYVVTAYHAATTTQ